MIVLFFFSILSTEIIFSATWIQFILLSNENDKFSAFVYEASHRSGNEGKKCVSFMHESVNDEENVKCVNVKCNKYICSTYAFSWDQVCQSMLVFGWNNDFPLIQKIVIQWCVWRMSNDCK